jgi:hypothetical protein
VKVCSIPLLACWALLLVALACRSDAPAPPGVEPQPDRASILVAAGSQAMPARPLVPPVPAPVSAARPLQVLSSASPALSVKACQPCRLEAQSGLSFDVRFQVSGDQGVSEIEVTRVVTEASAAPAPQSFKLEDGWSPTGDYFLQAVDLNFDGVLDLGIGPQRGTPNLTLQFWTVDGKRAALDSLGEFTNLTADPKARELRTFEKGGHAGLENANKSYRWEGGKLVLVRSTAQTSAGDGQRYLKTTQRLDQGRVVEEKREPVKAP